MHKERERPVQKASCCEKYGGENRQIFWNLIVPAAQTTSFKSFFFPVRGWHLLCFTEKTRSCKFLTYLCHRSRLWGSRMDVLNWSVPHCFLGSLIYYLPLFLPGSGTDPVVVCSVAREGVGGSVLPLPVQAVWRVTGHTFLPHLD